MKVLITVLTSIVLLSTPAMVSATPNAGKAFSGAVECSLANGSQTRMPRELCKLYGGKY